MKSGLLTDAELIEVTGYTRGADQTRALREQGYHPMPGRDGHPRITWEAMHARMAGLAAAPKDPEAANEALLNWSAVGGARGA